MKEGFEEGKVGEASRDGSVFEVWVRARGGRVGDVEGEVC